jgi:aryl-alcohol dehydrogenase-like predicted oxidoreductase
MSSLPQVELGRSDLRISRVGLGTWAMGGPRQGLHWGAQEDSESIATVQRAVEAGINWLDTAPIYGHGHAETVVGQALRTLPEPDRPLVFTKCGMTWDEADHFQPGGRSGRPEALRAEVDRSLARLGVERIDLYQMHQVPPDAALEEYWGVMLDLRDAGKVRAIGLSNHDVPRLEQAAAMGGLTSLQPPLSAIRRDAAAEVVPWCRAHEVGVISYGSLESGLLAGGFEADRMDRMDPDDWRRRSPAFTDQLPANLQVAAALAEVAERHEVTPAAAAAAWVLAWDGVTGAIVGARRPEQIDGWIDAARVTLADNDLDAVAAAIRASGAGQGPARP